MQRRKGAVTSSGTASMVTVSSGLSRVTVRAAVAPDGKVNPKPLSWISKVT